MNSDLTMRATVMRTLQKSQGAMANRAPEREARPHERPSIAAAGDNRSFVEELVRARASQSAATAR